MASSTVPDPSSSESIAQTDVSPKHVEGKSGNQPCPKCNNQLVDTAGLGWCPKCGYCRSIEEDRARLPIEEEEAAPRPKAPKPSLGGLVECGEALAGMPRWAVILLAGVFAFSLFSLLPASQLQPDSFERCLWTTSQIFIGLAMILGSQFAALIYIAPEDEKLSFKDCILPGRLWGLVFKRLPKMAMPLWIASWGLSLVVTAILFIGGLDYWMNYLPGRTPPHLQQQKSNTFRPWD